MPEYGDVLLNRATGQRLVIRRTVAQTRGRSIELSITYPPHGPRPPGHIHPEQEQVVEVLSGGLCAALDGRPTTLAAGGVLVVPAGAPHALWNAGAVEARAVLHLSPALSSQALLETLWALGSAGRTDRRGMPDILQAAVLLRAYRREFRLAWPPHSIQRPLVAALAPLGSLCGRPSRLTSPAGDG
jgi:quercetin dioxygenase-like cupin family protein